ncbi:MAG: hypothetical protein IPO47_13490 [Bacteroidetes bacterium]|nr:hypothetical protein [Bacteroidota bacterium]
MKNYSTWWYWLQRSAWLPLAKTRKKDHSEDEMDDLTLVVSAETFA